MNLDTLLEYQRFDIELRKILDEIERHEFNKKLEQAKNEFNQAKQNVNDSEKAAEAIIAFYNKSLVYFDDTVKRFETIEKTLESLDESESEKRAELIASLEVLRDKITELDKKLSQTREKSESVIHNYLESQERGKKLRDIFNSIKAKLEAFKLEKDPKIKELTSKLENMGKNIDKELFEKYKQLTADKKYPALVEAGSTDGGKSFSCNGCGLSLSQKAKSELAEKSICRCENCRRLIYKK